VSAGRIMNKHRGKAKTAVAERAAAVDAISSSHHSALIGLVRLLARQAATKFVAKREEDRNQCRPNRCIFRSPFSIQRRTVLGLTFRSSAVSVTE